MSNPRVKEVVLLETGKSGKAARRRRQRQNRKMRMRSGLAMAPTLRTPRQANVDSQRALDSGLIQQVKLGKSRNLNMGNRRLMSNAVGRVSQLTASSISKEYAEIQGAIVMPQVCPPERYSTEYASNPTAVANPWTIEDYPWFATANINYLLLAASELLIAIFRDPLRNSVTYDQNGDELSYTYNALCTPLTGSSAVPLSPLATKAVAEFEEEIRIPMWESVPTIDNYEPHGPFLYSGSDDQSDRSYRWFDRGEELSVIYNAAGASNITLDVTLTQFKQDAEISDSQAASVSVVAATAATVTLGILTEGYYAIRVHFTSSAPSIGSLAFVSQGNSAVFRHRPIPGFELNRLAVDGIRIVGVSAMYTNNAALIQKAGTISGLQVPKETDWQQFIGPLSSVSKISNSKTIDAVNGIYGFLKPTETKDFELIDVFASDPFTGAQTASYYSLRNVQSYLIVRASITPVDGRSGFVTIANSVEFLTTDVWRPLDTPKTEPEVYRKALEQLKTVTQWHENPTHVKELFNSILSGATSVIKGVQKYAPVALSVAELLGSFL